MKVFLRICVKPLFMKATTRVVIDVLITLTKKGPLLARAGVTKTSVMVKVPD